MLVGYSQPGLCSLKLATGFAVIVIDMKTEKSVAHGEMTAYWQGLALVACPKGYFNMQGIYEAAEKVDKLLKSRPAEFWARIYVYQDLQTLGPPESVGYVVEQFRQSIALGCRAVYVVGGSALNQEGFVQICNALELPLTFCDDLSQALSLVEQHSLEW